MDKNGDSALMLAVTNDNNEVMRLLLNHGALVNAVNGHGQTALWLAISGRAWSDDIQVRRPMQQLLCTVCALQGLPCSSWSADQSMC